MNKTTAFAGAAGLIAAALSAGTVVAKDADILIAYVGCAAPVGFHGAIHRGAEEAVLNLGINVRYTYPDPLSLDNQLDVINQAIDSRPDGIAICAFADDAAYTEVIDRATLAGIPVASGVAPLTGAGQRSADDPFLFRTGSDEGAAGFMTADRIIELGVDGTVLVANQVPDDATCQHRANAQAAALEARGYPVLNVQVPKKPDLQQAAFYELLQGNPGMVAATSVCDAPDSLIAASLQAGRTDLVISGYDFGGRTVEAITDGSQVFTIDQQPFWRGYMPVLLLTHYVKYGLMQANEFLTGPSLVDAGNIDQVAAQLSENNI